LFILDKFTSNIQNKIYSNFTDSIKTISYCISIRAVELIVFFIIVGIVFGIGIATDIYTKTDILIDIEIEIIISFRIDRETDIVSEISKNKI